MRETIIVVVDDKGYEQPERSHLSDKNDNNKVADDLNYTFSIKICDIMPMSSSVGGAKSLSPNSNNSSGVSPDSGKKNANNTRNEKRKSTSNKKPPRPPRAATSLPMGSAEQKLIKELSELATIKRNRIERMKALIKSKSSKESSSSSSTTVDNLIAVMLAVFFFCCIIGIALTQGCGSLRTINPNNSSTLGSIVPSLPPSNELATGQLSNLPSDVGDGSPNVMEVVVGRNKIEAVKAIH